MANKDENPSWNDEDKDDSDECLRGPRGGINAFSGARAGDRIDDYQLVERLGEGGCGVVWMAERRQPHQQRVALKLIKPGMDSRNVIARFEQERQVLAMMSHPNIARVFDAGTTKFGSPYFVMEYVAGESITTYCDRNRLSNRERLELFIPVCEAVQHAHMKGIIHRDIKPSNILVSVVDGKATPKVIDFGVAKATVPHLSHRMLFTEHGVLIGTPEYMSPEQAEMGATDIDTRTDVYSLGTVLYELLTGLLPFDSKNLRSHGYAEIQRIIREVDPPKPSDRFAVATNGFVKSTSAQRAAPDAPTVFASSDAAGTPVSTSSTQEISDRRRTRAPALLQELRGDLDWIIVRAMEKDRSRRYESAAAFAEELRRHLRDEPVLAGPPGVVYRGRKFVRRHRIAVGFASTMAITLATAASLITMAYVRAAHERESARTLSSFLLGVIGGLNPDMTAGIADPKTASLDSVLSRLNSGELLKQPTVEAQVREAISNAYYAIGRLGDADRELGKAVELHVHCGNSLEAAAARVNHANVLIALGRLDDASAELVMAAGVLDAAGLQAAFARASLSGRQAAIAATKGDLAGATTLYQRAIARFADLKRAGEGGVDIARASLLTDLSEVLRRDHDLVQAETVSAEALTLMTSVAPADHPYTGDALNARALVLADRFEREQAVELLEKSLAIALTQHPEGSDGIEKRRNSLCNLLLQLGNFERVREITDASLPVARTSRNVARVLDLLAIRGTASMEIGELDEAERLLREGLSLRQLGGGVDDIMTSVFKTQLADVLIRRPNVMPESVALAQRLAQEALSIRETQLGPSHPQTQVTRSILGAAMCMSQPPGDGVPLLKQAARGMTDARTFPAWRKRGVVERLLKRLKTTQNIETSGDLEEWEAILRTFSKAPEFNAPGSPVLTLSFARIHTETFV
jgi:serine/threonine protein kinase